MERVYLLLRNNNETGPFTIGELLQQHLNSTDMIWIEGKSKAWTYLSELELTPFVAPSSADAEPSKDEIERKADELRQKILSSSTSYYAQGFAGRQVHSLPPYLSEPELQFIDHRKDKIQKRNLVIGELVLTTVVIGLFSLGIYKGKSFLSERKQAEDATATKLNTSDEHTAAQTKIKNAPVVIINTPDTTQTKDTAEAIVRRKPKHIHKIRQDSTHIQTTLQETDLTAAEPSKKEDVTQKIVVSPSITPKKEETVIKKVNTSPEENQKSVQKPEEKKKGFFLKNLFKKKKKEKEN